MPPDLHGLAGLHGDLLSERLSEHGAVVAGPPDDWSGNDGAVLCQSACQSTAPSLPDQSSGGDEPIVATRYPKPPTKASTSPTATHSGSVTPATSSTSASTGVPTRAA